MSKPLVSIQIPTYNQKNFITEAVESACNQNYSNLEILIADDCSSYDIREFLNQYETNPKIKVIVNSTNLGRVKNYRNTLYDHVHGKYFMNLDGDDYFVDFSFVEEAVNVLETYSSHNPVVFEYFHDVQKIKNIVGEFIEINENTILIDGLKYFENIHLINEFSHASCIFNTEVAKSINFYSINSLCADFESATRILLEGSIIVSDKKVAQWRIHENNASWSLSLKQYYLEKESIDNIIVSAQNKIESKKLKKIEEALQFGLYCKMLGSYRNNKKILESLRFILFNTKMKFSYLKVAAGLVLKNVIR